MSGKKEADLVGEVSGICEKLKKEKACLIGPLNSMHINMSLQEKHSNAFN